MAQTSGFFEAVWDDNILNPETQQYGDYDLRYYAYQFAEYFKNFVGNGVFASPVDQLKVSCGEGMTVNVNTGWGFINGYWYKNDEVVNLPIAINRTSSPRVDSVRLRYSEANRSITLAVFTGDITPVRTAMYYDLILAQVIVPASSGVISDASITDMRGDTSVCGFVTGLLEVVDTQDLFEQYTAIFNAWFDDIKGQISEDLGVQLQLEINQLDEDKEDAFTKNTAFNKNFGNSSGTVCEGNDSRLWTHTFQSTVPSSVGAKEIVYVYET